MELTLAPQSMPEVKGNFEQYKAELIVIVDSYKDKPLTEETVAPIKRSLQQMRTTLEKYESTAIGMYFDTPKKVLKAQFAELYNIIAEGENKADAVIAEDTRKRNDATTVRLVSYIKTKALSLVLEPDVVDHVSLDKSFYNKTAKEADVLDEIDKQLLMLEKNFDGFNRATRKINSLAKEVGPTFNKDRYIFALSKYGSGNADTAALAEEEADRLKKAVKEPQPAKAETQTCVPVKQKGAASLMMQEIIVGFPTYDKKTSKGSDDLHYTFSVPKESKKQFLELLKDLKTVGITSKKL